MSGSFLIGLGYNEDDAKLIYLYHEGRARYLAFLCDCEPLRFLHCCAPPKNSFNFYSCWFIPQPNTDKIIIALHGYPADKGDILPSLVFLHKDFNLLFFDFRYFGQSDGFYSTAGAREIYDLLVAVEFAKERGFTKIGIWGFSMGGAVALMGASKTAEIKAVVSDSSYASLSLLAQEPYRNFAFLKYPLAFFTGLWPKIFLGISIDEVSPAKKVMGMKTPVLLIHSLSDMVIPFSHALLLKEALKDNPSAEFWFQEEIRHGEFQKEYEVRIREFFQKNL